MRARLADESGVTMVELVITVAILGFVMSGLAVILIAGMRTSNDTSARAAGQGSIQTAVNRLEYELRCASGATVASDSASVTLTLPSQCANATGQYTWCVSGTSLEREAGSVCDASASVLATDVTSPAPFTLLTATGDLPRLQLALSVNSSTISNDTVSVTDVVTLRNAARS